jgi:hypothetical protein
MWVLQMIYSQNAGCTMIMPKVDIVGFFIVFSDNTPLIKKEGKLISIQTNSNNDILIKTLKGSISSLTLDTPKTQMQQKKIAHKLEHLAF